MSKINILPEHVCNRIAAGEVIERPASVVKELVENSVDAGASKVSIAIEKAGAKMICITDNGSGMDADDALLCFEQHATSKIADENDINTIMTFGFRGEAIPSIASVSRFSLRTRTKKSLEGMEVVVHGGKFIKEAPAGCAPGTEIIVRDLFFNIPARKKFLKTQATEERHIQEILLMLSLANPTVSFDLTIDGRSIFSTPGHKSLRPRLVSFFGKTMADALIDVDAEYDGITVRGFVARHGFTRTTRREQRTFVNNRGVEALSLYQGIKDGYGGLVEKGRFPPVVLFIGMDPLLVDVNVHPAKREVRFRKEQMIRNAVARTVSSALRETSAPTVSVDPALSLKNILDGAEVNYAAKAEAPELRFEDKKVTVKQFPMARPVIDGDDTVDVIAQKEVIKPLTAHPELVKTGKSSLEEALEKPPAHIQARLDKADPLTIKSSSPSVNAIPEKVDVPSVDKNHIPLEENIVDRSPESEESAHVEETVEITSSPSEPQVIDKPIQPEAPKRTTSDGKPHLPGSGPMQVVGILDDTYILATSGKGLIVIDQHAAHERVLFEQILHARESGETVSQGLLIPITIDLPRIEALFLEKNAHIFNGVGFEIEPFSENTLMVNSIPVGIDQENVNGLIRDMLSRFQDTGDLGRKVDYDSVAMAACKAAVKANDKLTMAEAQSLLHQMAQCDLPFSCPHGRPTIINISVKELEKRFGRT